MTATPPIDFRTFVASFATTASATLEHVRGLAVPDAPTPPAGEGAPSAADQIRTGLETARQLIDTLVMLEEKTRGNLTEPEQTLLRAALDDLRMDYVKTTDRAAKRPG